MIYVAAVALVLMGYCLSRYGPEIAKKWVGPFLESWGAWLAGSKPLSTASYVDDEVSVERIIDFDRRANAWKNLANISFSCALLSIVVGILIFLFADRIAINSNLLPDLKVERESIKAIISKLESNAHSTHKNSILLPEIAEDWSELSHTLRRIISAAERVQKENATSEFKVMAAGQKKRNKILERLGFKGNLTAYPSLVVKLDNVFKEQVLSKQKFHDLFEKWEKVISKSKSRDEFRPAEIDEIKTLNVETTEINSKVKLIEKALDKLAVDSMATFKAALSSDDRVALENKKRDLDEIDEEIATVRQQFNPNNLYSVIPLLVVRLGALILLIFLTQILLASYRYNTMLSAHYSTISDALKMAKKDDNMSMPDIEQFAQLLTSLDPKHVVYAVPTPPTQQIADLAKGR